MATPTWIPFESYKPRAQANAIRDALKRHGIKAKLVGKQGSERLAGQYAVFIQPKDAVKANRIAVSVLRDSNLMLVGRMSNPKIGSKLTKARIKLPSGKTVRGFVKKVGGKVKTFISTQTLKKNPSLKKRCANPNSSNEGQKAFEAGKAWKVKAHLSGVANARVVGYGFSKWWNSHSPRELTSTKKYLEKSFREGYKVAK